MQLTSANAQALRFAARLIDRKLKGKDLGDAIDVSSIYGGEHAGKVRVDIDVWSPHTDDDGFLHTVADRVLAVRKEVGGSFTKNDPETDDFAAQYARLERVEQGFVVSITTPRGNTCVRKQVSVEVIEHKATAAYIEERPVWEWDCTPLNRIADGVEPDLEGVSA